MNISAQNKAALFSLFQEFAANSPALNRAANDFCDFRNMSGAKPGSTPAAIPSTSGGSPTGGGCGCGGGGSSTPSTAPGSACTPGGIGSFNIQGVNVALAPCDIERIERQNKLLTFSGSLLGGGIAVGDTIAVEIPAVHVSHSLCMERFRVSLVTGDVEVPVVIGEVGLQPEIIVTSPQGSYIHAWDYYDPERPLYTDVTDARCACISLCVCVPSEAHARFIFVSPVAVPAGSELSVTVWGRRKDWMSACGPCPPPDQCDRVELTPTELAATAPVLYEVA